MVVVKVQRLQLGELTEYLRQRRQLVVGEVQLLQLGELTDRLGQFGESRLDKSSLGPVCDRLLRCGFRLEMALVFFCSAMGRVRKRGSN